MSATQWAPTEGVLLLRSPHGATMAVHFIGITLTLDPVVIEHPDLNLGYATHYGGTELSHYEVEATGRADKITIWEGADPFAKQELAEPRKEVGA